MTESQATSYEDPASGHRAVWPSLGLSALIRLQRNVAGTPPLQLGFSTIRKPALCAELLTQEKEDFPSAAMALGSAMGAHHVNTATAKAFQVKIKDVVMAWTHMESSVGLVNCAMLIVPLPPQNATHSPCC